MALALDNNEVAAVGRTTLCVNFPFGSAFSGDNLLSLKSAETKMLSELIE